MRSKLPLVLIASALSVAASSCASRVETQRTFPPAADLPPAAEPVYPIEALAPCPSNLRSDPCPAEDAEKAWWNSVLLWGRGDSAKVARICKWAVDLGFKAPDDFCVPR